MIFYTTDPTVSDWVMENVMGDRMTFTVRGLTPSTQYFYKMHARNVKGFGPFSSVGNFTTLPGKKIQVEKKKCKMQKKINIFLMFNAENMKAYLNVYF